MLSKKIKSYLIQEALYSENDDTNYKTVMSDLGVDENTSFADFNLNTNSVTFSGQSSDIYNVCWFAINSSYFEQIKNMQSALKLPVEYLPLDSFEAEGGFFYNKRTGEVLELELGEKLNAFHQGKLQPQWKDFNAFLEWYFTLN